MFCSTPIEGTPRPKTTDNTIFKKKLFREIHPRFRFLTDLSLHGGVAAQQLLHAAVGQRQLLLDVQVRLHRHRRRRLRVVRRRRRRHLQQPHLSPPSKNVSHGIQGGGRVTFQDWRPPSSPCRRPTTPRGSRPRRRRCRRAAPRPKRRAATRPKRAAAGCLLPTRTKKHIKMQHQQQQRGGGGGGGGRRRKRDGEGGRRKRDGGGGGGGGGRRKRDGDLGRRGSRSGGVWPRTAGR